MVFTLEHLISHCAEQPYTLRAGGRKLGVAKKEILEEVWEAH